MADDQRFGLGFASVALVFDGFARPTKRKSDETTSSMIMHGFVFKGVARTNLTRFNCFTSYLRQGRCEQDIATPNQSNLQLHNVLNVLTNP
jgi:hypothetical protein